MIRFRTHAIVRLPFRDANDGVTNDTNDRGNNTNRGTNTSREFVILMTVKEVRFYVRNVRAQSKLGLKSTDVNNRMMFTEYRFESQFPLILT